MFLGNNSSAAAWPDSSLVPRPRLPAPGYEARPDPSSLQRVSLVPRPVRVKRAWEHSYAMGVTCKTTVPLKGTASLVPRPLVNERPGYEARLLLAITWVMLLQIATPQSHTFPYTLLASILSYCTVQVMMFRGLVLWPCSATSSTRSFSHSCV